jgi:hypothetical protein
VDQSAEIHQIYLKGGVKLVVEGHDHIYNAQLHDGIDYRIAGGAGAPLDGPSTDGGYYHFMIVHAHDGKLDATPVPLGTLEILPNGDGSVIACDYADNDLPCTNILVTSKFKPANVAASYTTKKKKTTDVACAIVSTKQVDGGYQTRIAITLPRAHATKIVVSP